MQVTVTTGERGLEASFAPDPGALRDPLDGRAIARVELRVATDGRVRIHAPSLLANVPERAWHELPAPAALCAELQAALDKQQQDSEATCAELARLGFEAEIDPETRRVVFALEIDRGRAVVLECEGDRVVARTLHTRDAAPVALVDLDFARRTLPARATLAAQLALALERRRAGSRAEPPGITLGSLLAALGPDCVIDAPARLSRRMTLHGEEARLELELPESGPATLRLLGPQGTLWTRTLDRDALAQWEHIAREE